jgi:transcriptional regulator with XRE-family HTH domain
MLNTPPDTQTDARLIGRAAQSVRRSRRLTARQTATAMDLSLRTYEYFEAGAGRVNLDHIHRFAAVVDADPYALMVSPAFGSTELARRTADTKLMLIFLQALGEFERQAGERMLTLDPRDLIRAFTATFVHLEADLHHRLDATAGLRLARKDPPTPRSDAPPR